MRLLRDSGRRHCGCSIVGAQAPKPERDWPAHGHDAGARRYSPLKQINTANVSNLQLAWTYDTPAAVPPPPARGGGADSDEGAPADRCACTRRITCGAGDPRTRQSAATPLVVDGVMYMGTMYNRVVALDAETGKEIWVKDVGHTPSTRGHRVLAGDRTAFRRRSCLVRAMGRRC